MTAQPANTREDDNVLESNDGPGRRLRLARQALGMDIGRIAAQLHLKSSVISALEEDRYDELPGPVFVAGYMRKYARLVGMDPEPLLDAYRAVKPRTESRRSAAPRKIPEEVGSRHLTVRFTSILLVLVLGGVVALWWQNQSPSGEPAEETMEPPAAQTDTDAVEPDMVPIQVMEAPEPVPPVPEQVAIEMPEEPAVTAERVSEEPSPSSESVEPAPPGEATVEAGPEASETEPVEEEPLQDQATVADEQREAADEQQEAAEAPADGEIIMEFSGPCWVDIRDSERSFKLVGEMGDGDRHRLEGKPPYSVIIGNAAAVRITVAGEPFDVSSIARGNVARFSLDPTKLP